MKLRSLLIAIMLALASTITNAQTIQSIRPSIDSMISPAAPFIGKYPALPIYFHWIVQLAICEKLKLPPAKDFASIEFYEVNTTAFQINQDTTMDYLALTVAAENVMFISVAHVLNRGSMLHEFLHFLLYYNFPDHRYTGPDSLTGTLKNHPAIYFKHCGVNDNY